MFKYAMISNNKLYHISDNGRIEIDKIDLPNGIYKLCDLAIEKYLISNDFDILEYKEMYDKFNSYYIIEDETTKKFNTINDFKSFLQYVSKDVGILSCIGINERGKVATDSHKLKDTTKTSEDIFSINACCSQVLATLKYKTIDVLTDTKYAIFEAENVKVYVKNYEGNYPNYKAVIPTDNNDTITVDRKDLVKLLTKLKKFKYKQITLSSDFLHCLIPEVEYVNVNHNVKIEHSQAEYDIRFNLDMLLLICKDQNNDTLTLKTKSGKMPCNIGDSLLMPLRVINQSSLPIQQLTIK